MLKIIALKDLSEKGGSKIPLCPRASETKLIILIKTILLVVIMALSQNNGAVLFPSTSGHHLGYGLIK